MVSLPNQTPGLAFGPSSGRGLRVDPERLFFTPPSNPFCGSGTTMVAALKTGRNSIGVEIDPEYCRMTARYLKAESTDLFSNSKLSFEKALTDRACLVKEDQALYEVRPAKKKLG